MPATVQGSETPAILNPPAMVAGAMISDDSPSAEEVLLGAAQLSAKEHSVVRVKTPSESFSSTKTAVVYEKNQDTMTGQMGERKGQPIKYYLNESGRPGAGEYKSVDHLSEAEWAKCGAWLKYQFCLAKGIPTSQMNEHDRNLLQETVHEDKWVGADSKSVYATKLNDYGVKTVLDDSTSGGENAVPEFFDTNLIVTPLLHSEVFPHVEVVPVARGGAADGASHGTVTPVSTAEGTGITEFSTSSFISAFDTSFFPVSFALTFGKDFLQDAVVNFAQSVMNQIGARHLQWLDDQIINGDGTTEPQGLANASLTSAPTGTNTHQTYDFSDLLNLVFCVDKPHRNAFGGGAFRLIMNDTQYKEFRNEVTGVTGDDRPLFGMDLFNYNLSTVPVSIENNIANGTAYACNLRGYRLYRRQGLEFQRSTEGQTLLLSNEELMMARARWGGQITLPAYGCILSN